MSGLAMEGKDKAVDSAKYLGEQAKVFGGKAKARLEVEGEIQAAVEMLRNMTDPDLTVLKEHEEKIPLKIMQRAQGLVFMAELKGGMLFAGRCGTGIVIARLPGGGWSGPSCFATGGVSAGVMIGVSKSSTLIVLTNQTAIDVFAGKGQLKLGMDLEVTAGPIGRDISGSLRGGDGAGAQVAPCYSYSHTKGVFAGLSIDSSLLATNPSANAKFYGRPVSAKDILSGAVQPPAECQGLQELYTILKDIDQKARRQEVLASVTGVLPASAGGILGSALGK